MYVLCDRFNLLSIVHAISLLIIKGRWPKNKCYIFVLDPLPTTVIARFIVSTAKALHICIQEEEFQAGKLRDSEGQIVFTKARSESMNLAYTAASYTIKKYPTINKLNENWNNHTIYKFIGKTYEIESLNLLLKIMVAKAIIQKKKDACIGFFMQRNYRYSHSILKPYCKNLEINYYYSTIQAIKDRAKTSILLFLLYKRYKHYKSKLSKINNRKLASEKRFPTTGEAVLALQEDEIGMDRASRTQPHWLFSHDGIPRFNTYILNTNPILYENNKFNDFEKYRCFQIDSEILNSVSDVNRLKKLQIYKDLWRDVMVCLKTSFISSHRERYILFEITRLLVKAISMLGFCLKYRIKAFITCENYIDEADAVQLVAPSLNIKTLSYQYSNPGKLGPMMMTTADVMLTFSNMFQERWIHEKIKPKKFCSIGYIYDSSFSLLKKNAENIRNNMLRRGAEFIIAYFDENAYDDKYALISPDEHNKELEELLKLVIKFDDVGIIIKTQFQRNTPRKIKSIDLLRSEAEATGRYVELRRGSHRNIVFPAEAAMVADFAIGHSVGATAGLEAAIVGTRCVLLNPYGFEGANDRLYSQANIVFPSLEQALEAIRKYRRGENTFKDLGDWNPIIHNFDPFRDGKSASRLRKLIESSLIPSTK